MKAAWYERQGPADEVLVVGEMPDPLPEPGEVRIHVAASGISPGDVKKRQDSFGVGTDRLSPDWMAEQISALAPEGVHNVVEVAFHANIEADVGLLAQGGSIATFATRSLTINPVLATCVQECPHFLSRE